MTTEYKVKYDIASIISKTVSRMGNSQYESSSERYPNREIAEANFHLHFAAAYLSEKNTHCIYAEHPLDNAKRIDIIAFDSMQDEWIAMEVKGFVHPNYNAILGDLNRLQNLEEQTNFQGGSPVIKCMVIFNCYPEISEWWCKRNRKPVGAPIIDHARNEPIEGAYEAIASFLEKPGAIVGKESWYEPDGDWVYEILYVIFD